MKEIKQNPLKRIDFKKVFEKVFKNMKVLGQRLAYSIFLMFFAYRRKDTPNWAKHIIIGAIGYFLAPFDSIPDLTPILGYTDDLGVLSFGLVTIASYINDDVRIQARKKLKSIFGKIDFESISAVDEKL